MRRNRVLLHGGIFGGLGFYRLRCSIWTPIPRKTLGIWRSELKLP